MCEEKDLRFWISQRETFYDSIALKVINEYGKYAVVRIPTVFGPIYHAGC